MDGGAPFLHVGGDVGCLLIHGFTGAPEEMRWLGDDLAKRGHTVLGIRLAGHGSDVRDLRRVRARDWHASVEDGYHLLRGRARIIVPIGLSLGGALALSCAARFPCAGVVAMATPFAVPDRRAAALHWLLPALSTLVPDIPQGEGDFHDQDAARLHVEYPKHPLRAVAELEPALAAMRADLAEVRVPSLLVYSRGDTVVAPQHAERIHAALGAHVREILWLDDSGHAIPRDAERERVFASVGDFVAGLPGVGPKTHVG